MYNCTYTKKYYLEKQNNMSYNYFDIRKIIIIEVQHEITKANYL